MSVAGAHAIDWSGFPPVLARAGVPGIALLNLRRCELQNTKVIHNMKLPWCLNNTNTDVEAHSPRICRSLHGWTRAVCLGLAVLAGTFASVSRAQELYPSLDWAVFKLTEELVKRGSLQGEDKPRVLAIPRDFFEMESSGFRMPLSELLSARFGTQLGRNGVRMVREGIADEREVRVLHGRWVWHESEGRLYLKLFVVEMSEHGVLNELVAADGEVVKVGERTKKALEPTLAHSGRYLVQQLDRRARDRNERSVYLRPLSLTGEEVAQPNEIGQELTDWLRNALIESRLFELTESGPEEVDGELLGTVHVGREYIQVDLRIRGNQPHHVVVTSASVKLPRELIRIENACRMHFREGRLPDAAECFLAALDRNPDENRQAMVWLTRIEERYVERAEEAIRRGGFDEAEIDVKQLRELNHDHPRLLDLEGMIARREMKDCNECPELVVVPSGSFMMGSPSGEDDRSGDEEEPMHEVTIAEPFAVGMYEVTVREFDRFVESVGYSTGDACSTFDGEKWESRSGRGWRNPGFEQTERHPVVCVSWEDAQRYVRWLSRKTGQAYRLLSESEWEYTARARTSGPFHFGSTISTRRANYDGTYTYGSGRKAEYRKRTVSVGALAPANEFGLHDVHGNVWEWVEDCWHEGYTEAPVDGTAWTKGGDCTLRGMRGGSWYNKPKHLRSAFRGWNTPESRHYDVGFRIARNLTP